MTNVFTKQLAEISLLEFQRNDLLDVIKVLKSRVQELDKSLHDQIEEDANRIAIRDNRIAELEEKQDVILSERNHAYDQLGWSRECSIYEFMPKDKTQKELEEITQAFGLLTTLHPTMEIDTSDYMGMAKKIVEYVQELKSDPRWGGWRPQPPKEGE